jgi:hypothetical protein
MLLVFSENCGLCNTFFAEIAYVGSEVNAKRDIVNKYVSK